MRSPKCRRIDAAIKETERAHAAAHDRDSVGRAAVFEPLDLPAFDTENYRRRPCS